MPVSWSYCGICWRDINVHYLIGNTCFGNFFPLFQYCGLEAQSLACSDHDLSNVKGGALGKLLQLHSAAVLQTALLIGQYLH